MKKKMAGMYVVFYLFAAMVLATGCDNPSLHRPEKVNGTIISLDATKKEIVMKDSSSGKQRTITVKSAEQMAALKPGMEIKAKIKRGGTEAEKITPLAQKDPGKKGKQKAGEE